MSKFSLPAKSVRLILVGLIVMVSGYILMMGGGSSDPDVFNEAMFDFRRLVASPLLVLMGIVIIIVSIMKPRGDRNGEEKK